MTVALPARVATKNRVSARGWWLALLHGTRRQWSRKALFSLTRLLAFVPIADGFHIFELGPNLLQHGPEASRGPYTQTPIRAMCTQPNSELHT